MPQTIIDQMLQIRETTTLAEKKNSIKEVVQEIALCGLSRAGFFDKAAFYGGTALRIFHGLDRFSEDLDFSLMLPDNNFDFSEYLPVLEKEIDSYGLHFSCETKEKAHDSDIKSAFLKGNTREHLLTFFANEKLAASIHTDELIKIKLEVDINPPSFAGFERKYRLLPVPYEINLYDMPSLFSGKLHALICRAWRSRVKGRDLYDYVFYLSKNVSFNMKHLEARMVQTGAIPPEQLLTLAEVKEILYSRFSKIDYEQAKQDVRPFISRPESLDLWSDGFFSSITENLKAET